MTRIATALPIITLVIMTLSLASTRVGVATPLAGFAGFMAAWFLGGLASVLVGGLAWWLAADETAAGLALRGVLGGIALLLPGIVMALFRNLGCPGPMGDVS